MGVTRAVLSACLGFFAGNAARASVLIVAPDAPGEPCPAHAELARAVTRQLALEVRSGGAPAGDDLVLSLAPAPAGWSFTVRRANQELALQRELPATAGGCVELAADCASILDRYLASIAWTGEPIRLEVSRPAPAPPRRAIDSISLAAGLAVWGSHQDALLGGSLDVAVHITSRWLAGVDLLLTGPVGRSVSYVDPLLGPLTLGQVQHEAAWLLASGGVCTGTRWVACVGPAAGVGAAWEWASGADLYRKQPVFAARPAAGVWARGSVLLPAGFEAQLAVVGLAELNAPAFTVQGVDASAFPASTLQWATSAGIGRVF
jgi:hypothetical protein